MLDHMSSTGVMHGDGRQRGEEGGKHKKEKKDITGGIVTLSGCKGYCGHSLWLVRDAGVAFLRQFCLGDVWFVVWCFVYLFGQEV